MSARPAPPTLLPWALSALAAAADLPARLEPLAGDASSRRYFRLLLGDRRYVLAHAPPASENNAAFIAVRKLLADAGVRVPALHAVDLEQGYLLLEDLGDRLLLAELAEQSVDGYYRDAFQPLLRMAAANVGGTGLRAYDRDLLAEELGRFPEWFVAGLLQYPLDSREQELLREFFTILIDSALEQPRVLVHRDFHSRNLMLLNGDGLGVIDFQDAVVGPVTYDIVSLLRDCYVRWPGQRVRDWALAYRDLLVAQRLLPAMDDAQFLRWFDWMGLQRHIKVLGTFARLYLRDGKAGYLADLPLVLDYVQEVLAVYAAGEPRFAAVRDWFAARLEPLIATQPWSRRP